MIRTLTALPLAALLSGCAQVCILVLPPAGASCFGPQAVSRVPAVAREQCGTDTECEEQCLAELRPDEDPAVCAVSLAPVK